MINFTHEIKHGRLAASTDAGQGIRLLFSAGILFLVYYFTSFEFAMLFGVSSIIAQLAILRDALKYETS